MRLRTDDAGGGGDDWLSSAHECLLLDGAGSVLAAQGCGARLGGVPLASLVGRPVVDALREHDGLALPAGFAESLGAALDRVATSGDPQRTPVLSLPLSAAEAPAPGCGLRASLNPVLDRDRSLCAIVVAIEQVEPPVAESSAAIHERNAELERTNQELLRVIAEQLKTEKALQRSQEQLQHARRLEAIGRLAGGIAHDFNNLLSVVLGYSISLVNELSEGDPLRADIDEIRRAGERAAELTQQLLAFGRQQVLEPKVLDLNDVLRRVDRMVQRLLGEDVEMITLPAPGLWKVKVDPGQLEQVILNLVINARDAMPSGGRLTIETANAEFDEDYAQVHEGASAGPHVVLAITDTGVGIEREMQGRIFEPFFTTKEKGKGTGLGLSTVFGIVKQSGGHIWLYSEPGKGSTFKVCFPRTVEASGLDPRLPSSPRPAPRGSETVLLVEDDAQLRALARTILVRHGYSVLEAAGPSEAMRVSAAHVGDIALLLTDVVMPQMSGRELARQLVSHRPGLKVLYMSGYTDNAIVHNGVLDAGLWFLQKPITPDVLAKKVREVLDSDRAGDARGGK